jgi:hypothetical protein
MEGNMPENESILLTAEGNSANIELTKTSLKINEYKKGFMGYDKSKITNVNEIPRDTIVMAEALQNEFIITLSDGYIRIPIDVTGGYWQGFKNIAEEIGLQGYWYEDNSKLSHIESYENEEQASIDANKAAMKGWMPQSTSATDGHVNIGRTLARGLIFGAHRTKGKFTITYGRTPEWMAAHNNAMSPPLAPIQATGPQPADDPLQKMMQLKGMLDAGLISESEYNAKKTDLLSRM